MDVLFYPCWRHAKQVAVFFLDWLNLSFPSFLRPQESLSSACSTSKGCAHDVGSIDQKVKGLLFREFLLCEWCNDSKESNDCSRTLGEAKDRSGIILREEHFSFDTLLFWHVCLQFVTKTSSGKATQHLGEKITIVFFSLSNDAPYINPKNLPVLWLCPLTVRGSQIQTRKVAVTFAKPQNQEQALESNLNAKAEQDRRKTQQVIR